MARDLWKCYNWEIPVKSWWSLRRPHPLVVIHNDASGADREGSDGVHVLTRGYAFLSFRCSNAHLKDLGEGCQNATWHFSFFPQPFGTHIYSDPLFKCNSFFPEISGRLHITSVGETGDYHTRPGPGRESTLDGCLISAGVTQDMLLLVPSLPLPSLPSLLFL